MVEISAQSQQDIAPHRFAALSNSPGQLSSEKLSRGRHISSRWLTGHYQAESPAAQPEEVRSWDLRFVNFFSAKFKIPFILDEYPDGTFILLKQSNMVSFSSLLRV